MFLKFLLFFVENNFGQNAEFNYIPVDLEESLFYGSGDQSDNFIDLEFIIIVFSAFFIKNIYNYFVKLHHFKE